MACDFITIRKKLRKKQGQSKANEGLNVDLLGQRLNRSLKVISYRQRRLHEKLNGN